MAALKQLAEQRKVDAERLERVAPELRIEAVAGQSWAQLLKRPEITMERILPALEEAMEENALLRPMLTRDADSLASIRRNEIRAVETEIKFAGYLEQQTRAIQKLKDAEGVAIPAWLDYTVISGLSREMQEKLGRVRPATIGQASRIPGVTPAALGLVHVSIRIQGQIQSQPQGQARSGQRQRVAAERGQ
uniref:Glucose inhibited division protein A n=1 Tax=mine drainage metagenome TaxID=410659 RepID=E6PWM1_9ZZZZ